MATQWRGKSEEVVGAPLVRYRNRDIGAGELEFLRAAISSKQWSTRVELAEFICESWQWRQANGGLSLHGCFDLLRRLAEWGYSRRRRKFVESPVLDAMPHDQISLYPFVLSAYLHYRMELSVRHREKLLEHCGLTISPGGLTRGRQRLATHLRPAYDQILDRVKDSLVKMADETSWRIWGVTHWLWYFGSQYWSYYVIAEPRT